MADSRIVVWSEGMFMRPQHLQQHTRYVESLVHEVSISTSRFGWGFTELILDTSLLGAGQIGISTARGLFQDATPFAVSGDTAIAPLNVSKVPPSTRICLAIAPRGGGAQGQEFVTGDAGADRARYLARDIDVIDNAAELAETEPGEDIAAASQVDVAPVRVGMLRLRLVAESGLPADALALPVARIEDVMSDGSVRLDRHFVPPVTRISAAPVLSQHVRELSGVVTSRADQLARKAGDVVAGADLSIQILWLMTANRYDAVLRHLLSMDPHPVDFYRFLIGMEGELATLNSHLKRPADLPDYDHANPEAAFGPLMDALRNIWSTEYVDPVKTLPLVFSPERQTWVSTISDHNLLSRADFVLAATASITEDELATRLPQQMVVAPVEQIDARASDVRLSLAKVKPRNVPTLNRWVYFHLETGGRSWGELSNSAAFAFFVDGLEQSFPDLQLKFWAVPHG